MNRKALGKGLRSLIPDSPLGSDAPQTPAPAREPVGGAAVLSIDLDRIRPNRQQPRRAFHSETLDALAASLKEEGVIQPIVVRPLESGTYEIVAGERRWRAAQRAGLLAIPALVRAVPDDRLLEVALVENLQREDLNPIEEAEAYRTLIESMGLTQQEVAEKVGRQRTTVTNTLRLLSLPPRVQALVSTGELPMGHARALLSMGDPAAQERLANRAVKEGLSTRQVEALASPKPAASGDSGPPARRIDPNVASAQQNLQRLLGTKVRIVAGRRGGRIELHYYSEEELSRLYDLLHRAGKRVGA